MLPQFRDGDSIQAPLAKASAALAAGVGAGAMSVGAQVQAFLPTDLAGWMGLAASAAAFVYSFTLLTEWWWKKVWKPLLRRVGWL